MVKLPLKVGQEHVASLARMHDPVGAIEELVWNALDADAENVVIELETNELGGVERVTVSDDGTGMAAERCAEYLLDRTPLSSLIKASTNATARLDLLAALEHLVFEPEARGRVKERTELHRILENECWVFGEEYGLHASDRSLNEVLKQHCALLGRDAPEPAPVLREDGRRGIVDLMLSRVARHRQGERHHLVVELKRPSVVLGMEELGQVTSYAQAVRQDDRFRDTRVTWDFWLVGNSMDDSLRQMAHQRDREPGCVVDQPTYRVWVRTWGEIIADCEERLRFYRDQLEYQSTTEHAVDYLMRQHPDAVCELAADGTLPGARAAADDMPGATNGRGNRPGPRTTSPSPLR